MDPTPEGQPASSEPAIDPALAALARERLRSEQNLGAAVLAGLVAAALGAAAWAAATLATGYQIGWMALGIGFLVGYAVRVAGRGIDPVFGIAGAALSLLGCAAGNLLASCGFVARQQGMPFMEVLERLDLDLATELMVASFNPMDLLFYAIAVYEGFRLSARQLSASDLGAPPAPLG